ncbi:quaternary ammonium compound-resistance protein SugE [Pedobacter nyackensis]|uniref:Guanidinium exporter n=2 Tax=Pedobacter nyackensis TaxID=475255 RepID=A0A1W1ZZG2_9SPHI|nr:quaternary ammonium compound-resistance protein SugE [Pedobacter nyackensis]
MFSLFLHLNAEICPNILPKAEINSRQLNNNKMNWIFLILGGLFEVAFASCLGKMKETTGNATIMWGAGFLVCLIISMGLLIKATETLPIGTAYAVWTGIGAVGTVLVGIFIFNEPATFWRIVFITTLICSIIGLKAVSSH